jgi:hypothetical protein
LQKSFFKRKNKLQEDTQESRKQYKHEYFCAVIELLSASMVKWSFSNHITAKKTISAKEDDGLTKDNKRILETLGIQL